MPAAEPIEIRPLAGDLTDPAALIGLVADVHEVAALAPVLEHQRRLPVPQAGGEDGEHARVRVRQGLARPVDVEQAERAGLHAVGAGDDQRHPLLDVLVEGVDGGEVRRLALRRRHRRERPSVGIERIPAVALRPHGGIERCSVGRDVAALAVDAHRRGDDHAPHGAFQELLEQHGRAEVVDRRVAVDLVHALPDAHLGGQMEDAIDVGERVADRSRVADVAVPEVHPLGQVGRRDGIRPVHLLDQGVQDPHLGTVGQQGGRQVTSDEACAAGDEIAFCHDVDVPSPACPGLVRGNGGPAGQAHPPAVPRPDVPLPNARQNKWFLLNHACGGTCVAGSDRAGRSGSGQDDDALTCAFIPGAAVMPWTTTDAAMTRDVACHTVLSPVRSRVSIA